MSTRPGSQESRKRQSKKDEAIRRKIESELNKKRTQGSRTSRLRKGPPGTVLSLMPSDPLLCKYSVTAYEAAQLMSAKRENCVLVADDNGSLSGIFTAKDLAFRVVGCGATASTTSIDAIMTPNPICAQASDPASGALKLMVEKGFRHLPVLDENGRVVGVLDITRCYAQQMERLDRWYTSSKTLHDALDSMHPDVDHPRQVLEYFADLKSKMDAPTLASVLDDSGSAPVYTTVKSSVYEATVLMKENRTTAVLVKDTNDAVSGIFTSKDVVLRVIAAGLDPSRCSVVRVMTPLPDLARSSLSVQHALHQMFDGHYLNLPVVDDDDETEIIGMVDVLRLTHVTLRQITKFELPSADSGLLSEGPAWSKFWCSLENESDSVTSATLNGNHDNLIHLVPSGSHSLTADVNPSDSVSAANESSLSKPISSRLEEFEEAFVFKFRTKSRVHRVALGAGQTLDDLKRAIDVKLHPKDVALLALADSESYALSYIDDEGDIVSITSDSDLFDCIRIHTRLSLHKADLFVHNPHEQPDTTDIKPLSPPQQRDLIAGLPNPTLVSAAVAVATGIAAIFYVSRR